VRKGVRSPSQFDRGSSSCHPAISSFDLFRRAQSSEPSQASPSQAAITLPMDNREFNVRAILAGEARQDAPVTVKGWVRTRRDSKAGISFVHLSDGSSFHPVQVVAPNTLPNYDDDVMNLTTCC